MRPLLVLALLAFPVAAQAATFFTDDFENHLWTGSNANPWDTSACGSQFFPDGCNAVIDTQQPHAGTHSLHSHYAGPSGDGSFYDRQYTATEEIYWRFYYRTHAFTYADVGTKHMNFSDGNTNPSFWLYHLGSGRRYFEMDCEYCMEAGPPGDSLPYSDLQFLSDNPTNINDDQWYCVEGHIKFNTPGVSDGVIELWVDGTAQFSRTNVGMRGPSVSNPNNNSSLSQFKQIRQYTQDGSGYDNSGEMYYDDLVLGNTRIGCAGGGGGGSIIMFITQAAIVTSTFLQILFIGGYFWERRTVAVQAVVKFWRYAAEVPTPKEFFWAYRYKKAVKRWQKQAPPMLEHQPLETIQYMQPIQQQADLAPQNFSVKP